MYAFLAEPFVPKLPLKAPESTTSVSAIFKSDTGTPLKIFFIELAEYKSDPLEGTYPCRFAFGFSATNVGSQTSVPSYNLLDKM